jgi:hypothetical protein
MKGRGADTEVKGQFVQRRFLKGRNHHLERCVPVILAKVCRQARVWFDGDYAFIYEPSSLYHRDPSRLEHYHLALREDDDSQRFESWRTTTPDECIARLLPRAFPREWTLPAAIDPAKEKRRLEVLAAGLAGRGRTRARVADSDPALLELLTPEGRQALDRDLAALNLSRIKRHFPWDPHGRLALGTAVLLNVDPVATPGGGGRFACLAAIGPERHRDEQDIRVELAALFPVNQTHRWLDRPWMWQAVEPPATERLGLGDGSSEQDRAARSLRLLDEGRIEDALSLYGVTLSDDLHRIPGGQRISPPACCAHADASWTDLLVTTLRQAAPWLLPGAAPEEASRISRCTGKKPGKRARSWKLAIFPGQFHARKASLMLAADRDGRNPRFEIEATATNTRLADTSWKRPIEVDLLRYGVRFDDSPDEDAG